MLTFFQPVWLLLLIPLAAAWFAWPLPNRGLKVLRAVIFLLVVLALAQLAIKLPDRAGTVVVVAPQRIHAAKFRCGGKGNHRPAPQGDGTARPAWRRGVRAGHGRGAITAARGVRRIHGAGWRGPFELERRPR